MIPMRALVVDHPIVLRVTVIGWWLLLAAIAYWALAWEWFAYICLAVAALDTVLLPARVWLNNRRRRPSQGDSSTG